MNLINKFKSKNKLYVLKNIGFWIISIITILPALIGLIIWEPIIFISGISIDILDNIKFYILAILLPIFIIILYTKCAEKIFNDEKIGNELYLLYIMVLIAYILLDKYNII